MQVDSLEWKQNENIKIDVKIENLTSNAIVINDANFSFRVISISNNYSPLFGEVYFYSPVNLKKVKTTKLNFKKQDGLKTAVFETQNLKLNKNQAENFVIHLKNLKWDGNLSSFYPRKKFYDLIKKGNYKLVFFISCESCDSLKSDELKFSVM